MNFWKKVGQISFSILVIIVLVGIIYYNKEKYVPLYESAKIYLKIEKPCSKPILYYINILDPRFGKDQKSFEKDLLEATSIWNNVWQNDLFKYSKEEALKLSKLSGKRLAINLLYDKRQETTNTLQNIDNNISSGKENYQELKDKFNSLKTEYELKKDKINVMVSIYERDKSSYEKDVAYWNSKGGADKNTYNELEKRRQSLNTQVQKINTANKELNSIVTTINGIVTDLNSLGKDINEKIGVFNTVSMSNGPEFQEGEYVMDENGQRINIYQYNDHTKLIRVLAHEFGHALGIEHVNNKNSIMNAYNTGLDLKLSKDDIEALQTICE